MLVAYDGSRAKTERALPAGDPVHARYNLGGWVVDASADYGFDLGGTTLSPRIGVTYVDGRRQGVTESGNDFALWVAGKSARALFADAGVAMKVEMAGLSPYVEAGIRTRLTGDDAAAFATFNGATDSSAAMVASVGERNRTVARFSAGLATDVSQGVRVNVGYTGEYGSAARHNVSGGLSIKF